MHVFGTRTLEILGCVAAVSCMCVVVLIGFVKLGIPPHAPSGPRFFHCCRFQVEALLDRIGGEAPVMQYVARSFQELGYGSWAYRVVNSAGLGDVV